MHWGNMEKNPKKVIFTFETDGSLTAKDALKETIKIIGDKYTELGKKIKAKK